MLIRANQGHSIPVDVELKKTVLPKILYHGMGEKYIHFIKEVGLISKSRLYGFIDINKNYDETILDVPLIEEVHDDNEFEARWNDKSFFANFGVFYKSK